MSKTFKKVALALGSLTVVLPGVMIQQARAEKPSLANGIICVAKTNTDGRKVYAFTSVIDGATMNKKQPVSLTITEPVGTVDEAQILVVNKRTNTVTLTTLAEVTPPEMQPVAVARTMFVGKNTFTGKTGTGTPVTITLEGDLSKARIQHGNQTFNAKCQ